MTVNDLNKIKNLIDATLAGPFKIGSLVQYEVDDVCPCCKQPITRTKWGLIVDAKRDPYSGFAEMGDRLYVIMKSGDVLIGDSENGVGLQEPKDWNLIGIPRPKRA